MISRTLFQRTATPVLTRRGLSTASSSSSSATTSAFVLERQHIQQHAAKSTELWRKVSMYICIPGSIVLGVYMYGIESEHHHHAVHEYEHAGNQAPERTVYEYNNIRRKGFPWGDGSKSLFHNDLINHAANP